MPDAPPSPAPVSCAVCATSVSAPPPLSWSCHSSRRDTAWLCEACARHHIRAIEGRLDEAWW